MWIIDLVCGAVVIGGLVFWYHFLKRNTVTTHEVGLAEDRYHKWRVQKVIKFFGHVFKREDVNYFQNMEEARNDALAREEHLQSRRSHSVYSIDDLKQSLLLEQKKD